MKKTQQKNSKDGDAGRMKWAYVAIAVLIAVAMVGTYLAPILEKKPAAQVGDTAVIDYTIFTEDGARLSRPIRPSLRANTGKGILASS